MRLELANDWSGVFGVDYGSTFAFSTRCHLNEFGQGIQQVMHMKFEDIYEFFNSPPPIYLSKELAVCYVLSVLARGESYGTELIQLIESEYPAYRLSDTVLYSALKFLEDEQAIAGYWKKVEGRGRPRRMYRVRTDWLDRAQDLARLWQEYASRNNYPVARPPSTLEPAKEGTK